MQVHYAIVDQSRLSPLRSVVKDNLKTTFFPRSNTFERVKANANAGIETRPLNRVKYPKTLTNSQVQSVD